MSNQTSLQNNLSGDKAKWESLQSSLLGLYGKDVYTSWLQGVTFNKINFNALILNVKTRFIRDWIVAHYADKILDLYKKQDSNISRIEFQVLERTETKNTKSNVIDFEKKDFIQDSGSYGLSKIDERLVFDNFVVGKSNELAFAAANRIIDNLNKYNP
ncbi:MAG: DnaA N-terminal domain-containing protein, partial [Pseudomonadota bacterium]